MRRIVTPSSLALLIFLVFSVFFTLFCGPIGYFGDSWNSIYAGLYSKDFFHPQPVYRTDLYLRHRPVLYFFDAYLLQKRVGLWLHPTAHHFVLLLFLSFSVFLFGKLLEKIYPDEPLFIVITLLLIFFYGPVFASSFVRHNITFFFTGITFWGVSLLFLKLARTQSFFHGLVYIFLSFVFYLLSVFAAEFFILVILALPFLIYFATIWPPLMKNTDKVKHVILRTALPAGGMLATVLVMKYFIIKYIGRQTNFSILRAFIRLWKYLIVDVMYEIDVFKKVMGSNYRYLAFLLLVCLFLLIRNKKPALVKNCYTPFLLGGIIFPLAKAPFLVGAGGYEPGMSSYGGGHSISSVFGMILILSGMLLIKKSVIFYKISQFLLLLILSCNVAFTFILADASKEASRLQKSLYTSLLEICPDVEDSTAFIFLLPLKAKAQVVSGEDGTYVLPRIMYHNRTLQGRTLYSEGVSHDRRTTIITRDYIRPVSQGSEYHFSLDRAIFIKSTPQATFEIADLRRIDTLNAIWAESYFELTKDALHSIINAGMPDEIREQVKPLKNRAFFKEEFLEAVEGQIGKEQTERYQALILKHAWRWTETYFELTEQSMQNLRDEGVPAGILTWLDRRVKHRAFPTEDAFLEATEDYIGKEARERYREFFVKYAQKEVHSITEVKSNTNLIKQKRVENAFTKYLESLPD